MQTAEEENKTTRIIGKPWRCRYGVSVRRTNRVRKAQVAEKPNDRNERDQSPRPTNLTDRLRAGTWRRLTIYDFLSTIPPRVCPDVRPGNGPAECRVHGPRETTPGDRVPCTCRLWESRPGDRDRVLVGRTHLLQACCNPTPSMIYRCARVRGEISGFFEIDVEPRYFPQRRGRAGQKGRLSGTLRFWGPRVFHKVNFNRGSRHTLERRWMCFTRFEMFHFLARSRVDCVKSLRPDR